MQQGIVQVEKKFEIVATKTNRQTIRDKYKTPFRMLSNFGMYDTNEALRIMEWIVTKYGRKKGKKN